MKLMFSLFLLLVPLYVSASSVNAEGTVLEESDFQTLSKTMQSKSLGLLLLLHAEHCPYCTLMEEEILAPMVKSGDYDNKILIRKLQIDDVRDVIDFNGEVVDPSDISGAYDVTLTPTLVFLDADGNERAEKMVGINTVELFSAYLDAEIEKLLENIKAEKKVAQAN